MAGLVRKLSRERVRLLLLLLQRLLGEPRLGDVLSEDDNADEMAVVVAIGHLVRAHPAGLARRERERLDDAELRAARGNDLEVVGVIPGGLVRVEVPRGDSVEAGRREPERIRGGAGCAEDA